MKKDIVVSKPKVSIILPVYNVQGYLGKCLESLIAQTFEDIEIICVNDGSTDDSLTILEHFARLDKRVKIIDKKNAGVSAARNDGLKEATGEYIMFVDSDDWIEPETCEECYKKITQDNADLLIFEYYEYREGKGLSKTSTILDEFAVSDFRFEDCPDDFFYILTSVWGKVYKNTQLPEFQIDLTKGEDSVFFWTYCLQNNPKITLLNKPLYYYYLRSNSAMQQAKHIENNEVIRSARSLMALDIYQNSPRKTQALILDRFAQSLWWEIEHHSKILNKKYMAQASEFLYDLKKYKNSADLRFFQKLQTSIFRRRYKIANAFLKFLSACWHVEYKPRHKVVTILGIDLKIKRISGKLGVEKYYITQVRKNYKKYPKDTYLLYDCLHDATAEAIDAYSLFEKLREKNIPAYYVIRKQAALYKKLEAENKLDHIIALNFSTRTHPNEFMQKIWEVLLRTKYILTSFGENSGTVEMFLRRHPSWKYIFLQHGPTYMKESVLCNGYLYPKKFDKFLICSDREESLWLKYNFPPEKLLKVGLPRWDLLNNLPKPQEKSILLMLTWRQLNNITFRKSMYKKNLLGLLHNEKLHKYLQKNNITLYFAPHHALLGNAHVNFDLSGEQNIQIVESGNVSQYIRQCSGLITDFSSVAFDFMFQYKPVVFYVLDKDDPILSKTDKFDMGKFNYKQYIMPDVFLNEDAAVERVIEYCENNFEVDEFTRKIYDSFFYTKENIREQIIAELEKPDEE